MLNFICSDGDEILPNLLSDNSHDNNTDYNQQIHRLTLKCKHLTDALKSNEHIRDQEKLNYESKIKKLIELHNEEKESMLASFENTEKEFEVISNSNNDKYRAAIRSRDNDNLNLQHKIHELIEKNQSLCEVITTITSIPKSLKNTTTTSWTHDDIYRQIMKYNQSLTLDKQENKDSYSLSNSNYDVDDDYQCRDVHDIVYKLSLYINSLELQNNELSIKLESIATSKQEVMSQVYAVIEENKLLKKVVIDNRLEHALSKSEYRKNIACKSTPIDSRHETGQLSVLVTPQKYKGNDNISVGVTDYSSTSVESCTSTRGTQDSASDFQSERYGNTHKTASSSISNDSLQSPMFSPPVLGRGNKNLK